MKRFNFGNFLVDESNREAFEVCQDVADLKPSISMPVTILADAECGKTHLLYAIVNRVRTTSARAGLAYVTAHDFPDPVRALIDDPSPVENAHAAILLVDQLESFTTLVEELEAVIRIFLDNGHFVVLSSSVHPGRLSQLPPGLRSLVDTGTVIRMLPRPETRAELLTRQAREEAEIEINRQRGEILELRALLERVGKDTQTENSDKAASLRAQLKSERAAKTDVERKLEIAKAYCESLQQELTTVQDTLDKRARGGEPGNHDSLVAEAQELRSQLQQAQSAASAAETECERLREDVSELSTVGQELLDLRNRYEALQNEQGNWDAERARLEAIATEKTALESDSQALRAQLDTAQSEASEFRAKAQRLQEDVSSLTTAERELAQLRARLDEIESERTSALAAREDLRNQLEAKRAESDAFRAQVASLSDQLESAREESQRAREDANQLVRRAESLIAQIESNRATFAEADEERRHQIEELETLAAQREFPGMNADEWDALKARAAELEQSLRRAENDRADLQAALQRAQEDAEALQGAQAQALADREQTQIAWKRLKTELDEAGARLEQAESERDAFGIALQNAMDQRETLEMSFDQANAERTALRAALEQVQADRSASTTKLERLTDERNALELTLARSNEEREGVEASHREQCARGDALQTELETAKRELEILRTTLNQSEAEQNSLASALQEARRDLEQRSAALESLRLEAAAQVAGAHAQAGELEGRLHRLRASYDHTGSAVKMASTELATLHDQLAAASETLHGLAATLATVSDQMILNEASPRTGLGKDGSGFTDRAGNGGVDAVSMHDNSTPGSAGLEESQDDILLEGIAARTTPSDVETVTFGPAQAPGPHALPDLDVFDQEPDTPS